MKTLQADPGFHFNSIEIHKQKQNFSNIEIPLY